MSFNQAELECKLWRQASQSLADELEEIVNLLNETVTRDMPLPLPPSVTLYKLTVKAVDAANNNDMEGMARALREARQLMDE